MPYVTSLNVSPPHMAISDTPAWEAFLPDLKIQSDIAGIFRSGSRPLTIPELPGSLRFKRKKASVRDAFQGVNGLLGSGPIKGIPMFAAI